MRLIATLALLLSASPALGQTPGAGLSSPPSGHVVMRLAFTGEPGCSDPEPFVLALTPLVQGWDPLAPGGRWRLLVTVKRRAQGYEGTAELHEPDGRVAWTRSFPPKASCSILLDRLAYATAHRIDPVDGPPLALALASKPPELEATARSEPSKPPPMPLEPKSSMPERTPSTPPTAPARLVPRVGAGARAEFGTAWGAIFGVTIEGGVQRRQWQWGGWSLMGAFRWAPRQGGIGAPTDAVSIDVNTSLVAGNLTACVHRAWPVSLAGCVVGELGEIQAAAGAHRFSYGHQTALFAGVGVGARIEAPLSDRVYVQLATDVRGVAKVAGRTNRWNNVSGRTVGGAAGMLGAGVGVSF